MEAAKTHRAEQINFAQWKCEPHVKDTLFVAGALARGEPISAALALRAALAVAGRNENSEAFSKLAALLPALKVSMPDEPEVGKVDLQSLKPDRFLADAYDVAEPFWGNESIWGRDYVTMALLAADPQLRHMVADLEGCRDEWFRFVTSGTHLTRESWEDWWHKAGVPLPQERTPPSTDKTFLLTWDPSLFPFTEFERVARRVADEGAAVYSWNVGHKDVSRGDRVFFMRHGEEKAGLIGSGRIVSEAFEGRHWNPGKADATAVYARVAWDALREFPFVSRDKLVAETGEKTLWTADGSGLAVKPELADRLETVWAKALAYQRRVLPRPCLRTDAVPGLAACEDACDSLDVEGQATIFATLLIAEKVRPPYALGLLGDWGVGKSQFMRLMQKKVKRDAGKEAHAEENSGFVSRAAQIEFNAWHYVDSDLWASLASHIFDSLAEELCRRPDEIGLVRRQLRQRIQSSQLEQEQAEAAVKAAEKMRETAAAALATAQQERARLAADYEKQYLKRVWDAVRKVKRDPNNLDETGNWPDIEDLKTRVEKTAKRLGIDKTIKSAEDVQQVYASLRQVTGRGLGLAAAVASPWKGKKRALLSGIIAVLFLLLVVLGWPWILKRVDHFMKISEAGLSWLRSPLLQLAAIISAVSGWTAVRVKSISSALKYLETIQAEIRKPRIELTTPEKEEKALKGEIETLDAQIATEQQKIKEAGRQIADAQAEIQRINAGGLVYDFLGGRVRDSRYLDRLGLISVIRQDFEKLDALLRDWREHHDDDDANQVAPAERPWETRPIERIVLYIDDLDRCPPKRVVEVLEAVHLLLALPLFVVVVAVDARWLERSLNEIYNPWVARTDRGEPQEPVHRFNAHNYLEKILQIPFSLPAMNEKGYQQLVADDVAETERPEATSQNGTERQESNQAENRENPAPGTKEGKGGAMGEPGSKPEGNEGKEKETEERQKEQAEAQAQHRRQEQEATRARIVAMLPLEWEKDFISALYPFISTPRLARRFLNIYRLLRVRAADVEEDFLTFMDREKGDYRAVLILLAITVGRAAVASELLRDLANASTHNDFEAWLEDMSAQYEDQRLKLEAQRRAADIQTRPANPPSSREERLAELRDAAREIRGSIAAVRKTLSAMSGPAFDEHLPNYQKWTCEVGRYSLR